MKRASLSLQLKLVMESFHLKPFILDFFFFKQQVQLLQIDTFIRKTVQMDLFSLSLILNPSASQNTHFTQHT